MADTHETIADIIAEKRRRADELEASSYRPHQFLRERIAELRQEANRLEAAHKREAVTCSNQLREALEFCVKGMCGFCRMDAEARGMTTECVNGCEALRKAKAALAAPPRNCDRFATVDEARKAHEEYRTDYIMRASNIFDFPMEFEAWLFAPATEKEGGGR